MAVDLIYAVSGMKYGTPTGTTTMPSAGALVSLPQTVKGTIAIEEGEDTIQRFFTDQSPDPIKTLKTEKGIMTITAQFYDLTVGFLQALKGGTAVTGASQKYTPATTLTEVNKAFEITFESGHKLNVYNGSVSARLTGKGSRDAMMAWELKITPLVTADSGAPYDISKP